MHLFSIKGWSLTMEKKILLGIVTLFSVFFIVHYSLIILSAGPSNPISAKYKNIVNKYTSTIFDQNWHLFAPDPVNRNVHIYLQFTNNISEKENNQWIDITENFIKSNEKILTPYNRTIRLIDGIFADTEGSSYTDDLMIKYIDSTKDEKENPILEELDEHVESQQELGVDSLYKFGSSYIKSFMKDIYIDNKYLRVKLIAYDTTPFSERNNRNYKNEIEYSKTFDWKEIKDVSPMY